jgi:hypothetical protein
MLATLKYEKQNEKVVGVLEKTGEKITHSNI